jgi:ribonuclease J
VSEKSRVSTFFIAPVAKVQRTLRRYASSSTVVDGKTVGTITEEDLKDRRILAEEGFISVFVVIDPRTGLITAGPEIRARAFAEEDHVFDDVKPQIEKALLLAAREGIKDIHQLQQVIRRSVGGWVSKAHRRRPMIIPVVIHG